MAQKIKTGLFAIMTISFASLLIIFPSESLEASINGLNIWWEVVFPSLLPFFIVAELLIGFGIVAFVGVLLEPIMRPLFNVPGEGAFAWIMGMASGYPSGAKISARLREEKALSKIEAERLLTFTNSSSPLFMFGAIAIGFFHDAQLGLLIAICHYLGNFFVGVCMRFHGRSSDSSSIQIHRRFSFQNAFRKMHQSRVNDPRPFGEILGDSVLNSIKTLIMVGGFIVLFSVITTLLSVIQLIPMISAFFQVLFYGLGLAPELSLPFITGLFEISLGAQLISHTQVNSVLLQAIIISFILGFNGFSVQAQVSSIIAKTDIRFAPYFFARLLHGLFSSLFAIVLFDSLYVNRKLSEGFAHPVLQPLKSHLWVEGLHFLQNIGPLTTLICLLLGLIILFQKMFSKQTKNNHPRF